MREKIHFLESNFLFLLLAHALLSLGVIMLVLYVDDNARRALLILAGTIYTFLGALCFRAIIMALVRGKNLSSVLLALVAKIVLFFAFVIYLSSKTTVEVLFSFSGIVLLIPAGVLMACRGSIKEQG